MTRKREQERMQELLTEALVVLCRASLTFQHEFNVEGLLGITIDNEEIFLVNIKECVEKGRGKQLATKDRGTPLKRKASSPDDGEPSPRGESKMHKSDKGTQSTSSGGGQNIKTEPLQEYIISPIDKEAAPGNREVVLVSSGSGGTVMYDPVEDSPIPTEQDAEEGQASLSQHTATVDQQDTEMASPSSSQTDSEGLLQFRKTRKPPVVQDATTLSCATCGRTYKSQLALVKHMKTHTGYNQVYETIIPNVHVVSEEGESVTAVQHVVVPSAFMGTSSAWTPKKYELFCHLVANKDEKIDFDDNLVRGYCEDTYGAADAMVGDSDARRQRRLRLQRSLSKFAYDGENLFCAVKTKNKDTKRDVIEKRIVAPPHQVPEIMQQFHDSAGHHGITTTFRAISNVYHGICRTMVSEYIRACNHCMLNRNKNRDDEEEEIEETKIIFENASF